MRKVELRLLGATALIETPPCMLAIPAHAGPVRPYKFAPLPGTTF